MAERARHVQHARDEAREPAALHRCRETRDQPGNGALAHYGVPRKGQRSSDAPVTPLGAEALRTCTGFLLLASVAGSWKRALAESLIRAYFPVC